MFSYKLQVQEPSGLSFLKIAASILIVHDNCSWREAVLERSSSRTLRSLGALCGQKLLPDQTRRKTDNFPTQAPELNSFSSRIIDLEA